MVGPTYPHEPNYATPPGLVLKEWLKKIEISQAEFAKRCGRSPKLISQIISGDAPIEPETAIQFGRTLDCEPQLWSNMESIYRIRLAKLAEHTRNEQIFKSLQRVPLKELVARGFVAKPKTSGEQVEALLKFFGLGSLSAWNSRIEARSAAFRKTRGVELKYEIVETWLRIGELEANSQRCNDFSKLKFKQALESIKSLADKPIGDECKSIAGLCNQAGVAFAIVKPLKGTKVYGAARWLSPKKALIQLSFRGLVDDSAWFSFFHEAAHLLLHSKKMVHLEYSEASGEDIEREADAFAADMLISRDAWREFIANSDFRADAIRGFARCERITPGIVVGRLQHERRIPWPSKLNSLKTKYKWSYEE